MPVIHDEWVVSPLDSTSSDLPVRSELVRSMLARRGILDREAYRRFVNPSLDDLHDPSTIHGMDKASSRIERAIRNQEQILIYGDYDVDGVTSIVLLQTVLRILGARVDFVVPHRLFDGYGLKTEVLERVLAEKEVALVITVDCGITSIEPVEQALARGIDVIVTDHHLPPEMLPRAVAVLNPKQEGCVYPFKELAGVGVAFKLCCELLKRSGRTMSTASLAKIAAIGTIADVAPLIGENRTIARIGLNGLADSRNHGLRVLLRTLGLLGSPLRGVDVGFKIGPRINAAGRLASADTAIQLFAARDEAEAYPLVFELNRLNEQRRAIQDEVLREAESQIDPSSLPPIVIVAGMGWHKGVVGLCAGRISQKYHRPALAISIDGEECVGSGRSIPAIDLHDRLEQVRPLFTRFGGHSHACGFSLRRENLARLKDELIEIFSVIDRSDYRRVAEVEGVVKLGDLDRALFEEIEVLEPFGAGNPQPLLMASGVRVGARKMIAEESFSLELSDASGSAEGVAWRSHPGLPKLLEV
ncbi:MAG TPA: single-stranded-DNA-specific exonuclease RecJ [Thermoanaerobaculia bacterium]|nr:single-stranded-DNA-specific exonuclease RecJ [Thermoanaerobaculia bacterium]